MPNFRPVHVVTMVVALCAAAILTPVAVNASTGSLVNITDPLHLGSKANVSYKGSLSTTETDAVSGTQAKVAADGRRLVGDGDGPLTIDMAAPKTPWNQINDLTLVSGTSRRNLYTGLGPTKLNLTSLQVSNEAGSGPYKAFFIVYVSNTNTGDCVALTGASFGAAERFVVMVPAGETVVVTWPTPLVYSAYAGVGKRYCVDVESSVPTGALHIAASGFVS
jgi:hypothetical protein